jgi:protein-L-isoaspartate O-methyltransferase
MDWHGHDYGHMHRRRSSFLDVDRILKSLDPLADDVVIDVGSGDGMFSLKLAAIVRDVYPIDVNEEGHRVVQEAVARDGHRNIHPVIADVCNGIPVTGFTSALMVTSFHDFACRDDLLEDIKKKSSGKLKIAIAEFKKDATEMGPPVSIRISREDLDNIFARHGFKSVYYDEMGPLYINRYELMQ